VITQSPTRRWTSLEDVVRHRRVPFVMALLGCALVCAVGVAPANVTVRLDSRRRAVELNSAVEKAQYIIRAVVTHTTMFDTRLGTRQTVETRFRIRLVESLKGIPPLDSVASFVQEGGWVGTHAADSGGYAYRIGGQYLLMLSRCPDSSDLEQICFSCIVEIRGDSAEVNNGWLIEPLSALTDSIDAFMADCEPSGQARAADAVVLGAIRQATETDPNIPTMFSACDLVLAVDTVVAANRRLDLHPGDSLRVHIRANHRSWQTVAHWEVDGTRPPVHTGEQALTNLLGVVSTLRCIGGGGCLEE
jgi:hypothetical protein